MSRMSSSELVSIETDTKIAEVHRLLQAHGKSPEELRREVIEVVQSWVETHRERLGMVLMYAENARVYIAVGTTPPFDFELLEELCTLDLQIAHAGWNMTSHMAPLLTPDDDAKSATGKLRHFMNFCIDTDSDDEDLFMSDAVSFEEDPPLGRVERLLQGTKYAEH
jgi:hypothetical protein